MIPPRRACALVCLLGLLTAAGARGGDAPRPGDDPAAASAIAPALVHYQGRFTSPGGAPLPGPVTLTFSLHAAPTGGSALWSETHADVPLDDGTVSVLLGSIVAFPPEAFSAATRYLEIKVGETTLEPRLTVASVPFALEAERLGGKDASDFEPAGAADAAVGALAASDGTPPNEGANRLHWDQLTGVPAGFADGTDDEGAGVVDHGSLEGLGDDDHPQYLRRDAAATGDGTPPNEGQNLVSWENLAGVPADLADGIDNVFGGSGGDLVTGADVKDSTLTGEDLMPRSVGGERLKAGAVGTAELADGAVGASQIQANSVGTAAIVNGGVSSSDIADGAVGTVDLAVGSVTSVIIADGTIQTSDLGFVVGDISSVTAGPGLSGGGDTGAVTLSVGAGSGIQVVGTSVSLQPSYVSGSAYDARFVSRTAPIWTAQAAAATVAGAAFRPVTPTGKYTVSAVEGHLLVDDAGNPSPEDEFVAPVQLSHGAQITGFRVTVWDNTAASLEVALWRARQDGSSRTKVASVTTDQQLASWTVLSDDVITETEVDNLEFTYWLVADFPSTPQGVNLRLQSARVEYTVTRPN